TRATFAEVESAPPVVMPALVALVAGIHVLLSGAQRTRKTWMAGRSQDKPGHDVEGDDPERPESAVASGRVGQPHHFHACRSHSIRHSRPGGLARGRAHRA